jgi:hypothetical protein
MRFDQLKRREFITLLGAAAVLWPLVVRASRGSHPAALIATDPNGTTVEELHCRPQPPHVQWCSMSPGLT